MPEILETLEKLGDPGQVIDLSLDDKKLLGRLVASPEWQAFKRLARLFTAGDHGRVMRRGVDLMETERIRAEYERTNQLIARAETIGMEARKKGE